MTEKVLCGRPAFAASQRDQILKLLREAGPRRVSRPDLIFNHRFTQCGARIDELKHSGFVIESGLGEGAHYVHDVLKSDPRPDQDGDQSGDWYEPQTEGPRPRATDDLPLFSGGKG